MILDMDGRDGPMHGIRTNNTHNLYRETEVCMYVCPYMYPYVSVL